MADGAVKRIFVFSDTHGRIETAAGVVAADGHADMLFHLGDNIRDAYALQDKTGIETVCVRGNCDYSPDDTRRLVTVCGRRILLTHGHDLAVGYSLMRLSLAAEEAQADAALFGHTHRSQMEYYGGILLLNPGSISQPRGTVKRTYAVLTVSRDGIAANIYEV